MKIEINIQNIIDLCVNNIGSLGAHKVLLKEVERPFLEVLLRHTKGNQTKAAKIAGMNRRTLAAKLSLYGLKVTKEVKTL
jgi:Fis family transcriptional regulator